MAQPQYDRPPATNPPTPAGLAGGQVVIASYSSYAEAERAVDYLSDQKFPVERTAIVGRGLSSFEQVTGRLTIWRAAAQGAASGTVLGALFGWLFGLFDWVNPLISSLLLALYGAIFGAVLGALLGMLGHALTGGRRDFSSITGMRADSYDILVDATVAAQAGQLLDAPTAPGRGQASGQLR
ncbi:glycine zipper family protein [Micromonospora chalcea]|uniref:general stress protein n=1 Tax=Micromonospora chalcea TaxID=1874 RepID=UPI0021A303A1|nr:general stress protein [Micromonospora chalcea]MCT2279576.1 glycine zipper family protein [Micromonospora chalcea]